MSVFDIPAWIQGWSQTWNLYWKGNVDPVCQRKACYVWLTNVKKEKPVSLTNVSQWLSACYKMFWRLVNHSFHQGWPSCALWLPGDNLAVGLFPFGSTEVKWEAWCWVAVPSSPITLSKVNTPVGWEGGGITARGCPLAVGERRTETSVGENVY